MSAHPPYVDLCDSGELRRRATALAARLAACDLCPRACGANRHAGPGRCGLGARARLATAVPHCGEEPPVSGTRGSGGLFLGGCNLRCVACQNAQISQDPGHALAPEVDAATLAEAMLALQAAGCHNVNWVSPTPVVAQLLDALDLAARRGLRLPVVYNSNGYDRVDVLAALAGVVDVYLPDFKVWSARAGRRYAGVPDYPVVARAALVEMARQVGPLVVDADGIATRGVIVRHLVLPAGQSGTPHVLRFLATALPAGTAVSLMAQYAPAHRAATCPPLDRRVRPDEWQRALDALDASGLDLGWVQDPDDSPVTYRPDFGSPRPFADRTRVFPP